MIYCIAGSYKTDNFSADSNWDIIFKYLRENPAKTIR